MKITWNLTIFEVVHKIWRRISYNSQYKKQQSKRVSPERISMNNNVQSNCDDNGNAGNDSGDFCLSSNQMTPSENFQLNGGESTEIVSDSETYSEMPIKEHLQSFEATTKEGKSTADNIFHSQEQSTCSDEVVESVTVERSSDAGSNDHLVSEIEAAPRRAQLEDLIGMIKNAEKNILLLNQARISALTDVDTILTEKEALQGQVNTLERKLAETDARIKVAEQKKIQVELLESQMEELKNELSERRSSERIADGIDDENKIRFQSLTEEVSLLKKENISLKDDIHMLKEELNTVRESDNRILELEDERVSLNATLKNMESKLGLAQGDVAKLSTLELECRDLWGKVENLQELLDKATKQEDEIISVLQQNSELQKKVDSLEESLEEAKLNRLSSEKAQKSNERLQHKLKLIEEYVDKSDKKILSQVQLYEQAVKEFQNSLDNLKEENKKKAMGKPVEGMSWEFWSHLLLMIDGWFLEKKISSDDAKLLGEMTRKKDGRICDAYLACQNKNESEILATLLRLITSSTSSSGLHIIHIAAEMAPVAKVGGLGDVVSGLGKALQKRGHLVEIIIPKYDCMQYDRVSNFRALDVVVQSYFDGRLHNNKIWVGIVEGLPVYFIEPQHPANYFSRGQFYGENDDFKRFSYFSRAALELVLQCRKKPDIIHCHDWQTAFVAPLYWEIYASKGLNSARICFTCHNFEYQGTTHASELASCGLDVSQLNRPDRLQDNSAHDRVNPVKGAVVFSNIVTTVSPTYAQEVRTKEEGRGLHTTLDTCSKKFIGILNGIDTDAWDPSTDNFLKAQFNVDDLQGKMENKLNLRKHLNLSSDDPMLPLVGCITRLVPQKGVHLIRHAIYRTMELGGQFVLLGSSPVDHIQREFEGIAKQFENHPHIRLILKYDEALSHTIYAASDMFIIPSVFEPCGLTQMIAMRYGSVPIVRKTGGLNDSVFDVEDGAIPLQFRNGFTFLNPDEKAVSRALERAFSHYKQNRESWEQLVQRIMKIDFSWDSSANQYIELYEKSVERAKAAKQRA
ncbi:putative starch synthase 4 [Ranunculus cassubicifolius]